LVGVASGKREEAAMSGKKAFVALAVTTTALSASLPLPAWLAATTRANAAGL
jgi:hypothetical protein